MAAEVVGVPLGIVLGLDLLLAAVALVQKKVEELDGEHFDLLHGFKLGDVNVISLCDIQKYAV